MRAPPENANAALAGGGAAKEIDCQGRQFSLNTTALPTQGPARAARPLFRTFLRGYGYTDGEGKR